MARSFPSFPRGLILAVLTAGAVPAQAQGWAETWFNNVTYTSPGSFEDQTRGYVTAGGMSGRVDVHDDYAMSVNPAIRRVVDKFQNQPFVQFAVINRLREQSVASG